MRWLLCLFLLSLSAVGQSVDIEKIIVPGTVLGLRNPALGQRITLSESGEHGKGAIPGALATAGLVKVAKVELKSDRVVISGIRVLLIGMDLGHTLETANKVAVTVEFTPPATEESMRALMAKQFLMAGELQEISKDYFSWTADRKNAPKGSEIAKFRDGRSVFNLGRGMKPPSIIESPSPEDTMQFGSRMATVLCVVNEKGQIELLDIEQSSNSQFDLKALAAVSQWRFKPATKDGQPVSTVVNVQMNARGESQGILSEPSGPRLP